MKEDAHTQKLTQIETDQEGETSVLKQKNLQTTANLEEKCLQIIQDRDFAVQGREGIRNDLQRSQAESQMKDCRIANLNEIIGSKESLIEKLADDCSALNQRLEAIAFEK